MREFPASPIAALVDETPRCDLAESYGSDEVGQVLDAMSAACPGAFLLIDETYREARYGDERAAPSFAGMSPRVLTCASLSKAYGAAGLRAGWLTVPDPGLREQLRLAKFNSSVCCGAVDEFLAGRPLARADEILDHAGRRLTRAGRPATLP